MIFVLLFGIAVGNLRSPDSSIIVATSFASNASTTFNLNNNHNGPSVGKSESVGRFSVSLERTLSERGLNLITPKSGCHLSAWVFQAGGSNIKRDIDCNLAEGDILDEGKYHASQELHPETARHIQSFDTVYVNVKGLTMFVETILPNITTPIVLLVGQFHRVVRTIPKKTELALLNASCIVRVFTHNAGRHVHQPHHPKFAPWPYGVNPMPWRIQIYVKAFWSHQLDTPNKKTKGIMHGYLSNTNENRKNVPSGPKLNYTEYCEEIAQHRFILSPDGDRPECYRTYEAIGLGTVPITELSASLYHHLQPAPVLYETSDWNLNETQAVERLAVASPPTVNRMLVLEEYWLDYVEREIGGKELRWFDRIAMRKAKLTDFQILTE